MEVAVYLWKILLPDLFICQRIAAFLIPGPSFCALSMHAITTFLWLTFEYCSADICLVFSLEEVS